jgi:hypothetical protein
MKAIVNFLHRLTILGIKNYPKICLHISQKPTASFSQMTSKINYCEYEIMASICLQTRK